MNDPSSGSLEDKVDENVVRDATISLTWANVVALITLPIAYLIFFLPFRQIWDGRFVGPQSMLTSSSWGLLLLAMLPAILVHELLHIAGFLFVGKVPKSAVKLGISWKALAPYAYCGAPMSASAYRISVLLPGVLLGLIPGFAGVALGSGWLVMFGAVMAIAAGGDLAVLLAMRSVSGDALVRDHPSKAGCQVIRQ